MGGCQKRYLKAGYKMIILVEIPCIFCGNMKPIQDSGVWGPDDLTGDWVIHFPRFI